MSGHVTEFLGRQAILDRRHQVVAFELLFRAGMEDHACVTSDSAATAQVVHNAFKVFGIRRVAANCRAFINVDAASLMGSAITALPAAQVVIELLETISVDRDIVRRCLELKRLGYRLALDDFTVCGKEYEALLEIVDIVKVDIPMLAPEALLRLVEQLKKWPLRLLAEKVESLPRAIECQSMGFHLFQGFHYSRPVTMAF